MVDNYRPRLAMNKWLRRILMPIFARVNPGVICIRHHLTHKPFYLHSFRHRGYWFYGSQREHETISLFHTLINRGDVVFEIGAHIGYFSTFFAEKVGKNGQVIVFEPSEANLKLLRRNASAFPNIVVQAIAAGNRIGKASFFIENVTGQNNSLYADYRLFESTRKSAHINAQYQEITVDITTLDAFIEQTRFTPSFIKIDAEGAELEILQGAHNTLTKCQPIMMVEVTQNYGAVFDLLQTEGYHLMDEDRNPLMRNARFSGNVFCIPFDRDLPS